MMLLSLKNTGESLEILKDMEIMHAYKIMGRIDRCRTLEVHYKKVLIDRLGSWAFILLGFVGLLNGFFSHWWDM